jgi:hypothetical protein
MQIRTYNMRKEEEPSQPHFFILNKGQNSGRPTWYPLANCYIVISSTESENQKWYWSAYALWQGKCFHQYLRGSVIEFIIIKDCKDLLQQFYKKIEHNPKLFIDSIKMLQRIDSNIGNHKSCVKLFEEMKQGVVFKFLRQ